jgi:hypothetical protein
MGIFEETMEPSSGERPRRLHAGERATANIRETLLARIAGSPDTEGNAPDSSVVA